MFRKTILAVSVLTLTACGGGGGSDSSTTTPPTTKPTIPANGLETITVSGSLTTTTINKTQKTNLLIDGSDNTVYIQTPVSVLKIEGNLNKIDFANGVTVDSCEIKGSNNKATKSDLLQLNCTIDGNLNKGF